MPGRIKKCGYNSLGYCGWHVTWEGKRVFLRSTKEFIFARCLDEDKISYDTEIMSYKIGDKTYKPDFFLFEEGFLKKIVEIKGSKSEGAKAEDSYGSFFRDTLKIEYEVIWKFDKRISDYSLQKDVEDWKNDSILNYNKTDYSGENNPRYGQHCTDKTKKRISKKARERMKDPAYRENIRKKVKEYHTKNPDLSKEAYKHRTIRFAKKILAYYSIEEKELFEKANEYGCKARKEGVLPSNSGFSIETLNKYDIKKGDLL